MEEADERKRKCPEGHEIFNMISIEELSEGHFESLGIQVEPHPMALLMEASQLIMIVYEGIIEEISDDDEGSEKVAPRLKKGK